MSDVSLNSVCKSFDQIHACRNISTTFVSGSFTCLLGPSGCGKTTLLRIIAGLETLDTGTVFIGRSNVTSYSPSKREIGMVFQYPVVYRGLTVYKNLELPLVQGARRRKYSASSRRAKIDELLQVLELTPHAYELVDNLSSGEQQAVAVGRAVVRNPQLVLFDEPVTNVDVNSKIRIQRGIKQLSKIGQQTVIYVTHDQREAMTLADRLVLLKDGSILEDGLPADVYGNPRSTFGAYFLGSPGMNLIDATYKLVGVDAMVSSAMTGPVPIDVLDGVHDGARVTFGVRAESVSVLSASAPGAVPARVVENTLTAGGRRLLKCTLTDGTMVRALTLGDADRVLHDGVWLRAEPGSHRIFLNGTQ